MHDETVDRRTVTLAGPLVGFKERPGIYLSDGSFAEAVIHLEGTDAATGGQLLLGSKEKVKGRLGGGPRSVHWSGLLLRARLPGFDDRTGQRSRRSLTDHENAVVRDELFELVTAFLDRYGSTYEVAPVAGMTQVEDRPPDRSSENGVRVLKQRLRDYCAWTLPAEGQRWRTLTPFGPVFVTIVQQPLPGTHEDAHESIDPVPGA